MLLLAIFLFCRERLRWEALSTYLRTAIRLVVPASSFEIALMCHTRMYISIVPEEQHKHHHQHHDIIRGAEYQKLHQCIRTMNTLMTLSELISIRHVYPPKCKGERRECSDTKAKSDRSSWIDLHRRQKIPPLVSDRTRLWAARGTRTNKDITRRGLYRPPPSGSASSVRSLQGEIDGVEQ